MPLQKKTRVVLICLAALAAVVIGPMLLIMGSNLGAGILELALNRRPTMAELLGNYELNAPWGNATLRLNVDGTFQEQINENGKASRSVSGNWQSRGDSNFTSVDFRPFGMVWDDDHSEETSVYEIRYYKPHFGKTYGLIDDDVGEKFVRE